jgi:hypothetical protein
MKRQKPNSRGRQGAAMVEFAVVVPILMLFFGGMIEIAHLFLLQHTMDTAAYEGARSAMVPGGTRDDAIRATKSLIDIARLRSTNIIVSPSVIDESTALITVRVEAPVSANSWIMPRWVTSGNVVSEVTLFCERSPLIQLTGVPQLKAKSQKTKGKAVAL